MSTAFEQVDLNSLYILKLETRDPLLWSHSLVLQIQALNPPPWYIDQDPYTSEASDVWRDYQLAQLERILMAAQQVLEPRELAQIWWNLSRDSYALVCMGNRVLDTPWLNWIHPRLADVWQLSQGSPAQERLSVLNHLVDSAPIAYEPLPELDIPTIY